jgi:hypothetical protein
MTKYLCLGSLGVSGLMLLLFVADLAVGTPFTGISPTVDILGAVACGVVGYLSWEAFRDLR